MIFILCFNFLFVNPAVTRESNDYQRDLTKAFTTNQGLIKGNKVLTSEGFTYYEFIGIPYAQPPVGKLRFRPPVPADKWDGIMEAVNQSSKCIQTDGGDKVGGSEDCLYLNIYTKSMDKISKKLPVMIWIHGGGFTDGAAKDYASTTLIDKDVIVVTINYRLGGFGFLTFGNDEISGNMGLRDQAEAIEWVRNNIDFVGGDSNKITIFGISAGGISVHAHVLSPKNFGKLSGAISQSGTLLFYGTLPTEGKREEQIALDFLRKHNCSQLLDKSSLNCLQDIDSDELVLSFKEYSNDVFLSDKASYLWRPVVDNYASDPFLPLEPLEAMKRGIFNQIPYISGTVKNEGAIFPKLALKKLPPAPFITPDWYISTFGAKFLHIKPETKETTEEQRMLANIIIKYYNETSDESYKYIGDMVTDSGYLVPDQVTVKAMSEHNPAVFNYYFVQKTNHTVSGNLNVTYEETPVHGDDVIFIMDYKDRKELL